MLEGPELLEEAEKQLREAAVLIEEWGAYAQTHFKTKHNLEDDIAKINAYADRIKDYFGE